MKLELQRSISGNIRNFLRVDVFCFLDFGWKVLGYISVNIRSFSIVESESSIFQNIRNIFGGELNSSIFLKMRSFFKVIVSWNIRNFLGGFRFLKIRAFLRKYIYKNLFRAGFSTKNIRIFLGKNFESETGKCRVSLPEI